MVDAINYTTHAVVQVQSKKRVPAPKALPRPGEKAKNTIRVANIPGARPTTIGGESCPQESKPDGSESGSFPTRPASLEH